MELIKINKNIFKGKGKVSLPDGKITITTNYSLYIPKWIIKMGLINPQKLYEIMLTKEGAKITSIIFQERETDVNNNCFKVYMQQSYYLMSIVGLCKHYGIKPGRYPIVNLNNEGQTGFIINLN